MKIFDWIDNLPPKQRGLAWSAIGLIVVYFFFPQLRFLMSIALFIWAVPDIYAILEHKNGLTPLLVAKIVVAILILCIK